MITVPSRNFQEDLEQINVPDLHLSNYHWVRKKPGLLFEQRVQVLFKAIQHTHAHVHTHTHIHTHNHTTVYLKIICKHPRIFKCFFWLQFSFTINATSYELHGKSCGFELLPSLTYHNWSREPKELIGFYIPKRVLFNRL